MEKVFQRGIECLFSMVMTIIAILLLFFSQINFPVKKTFLLPNWAFVMLALCVTLVLMMVWRNCFSKRLCNRERHIDRMVGYATLALFLAEGYICFNILFSSDWDPGIVWKAAVFWAHGDHEEMDFWGVYFSIYPNKVLLLLLESMCYRVNHAIGIFGESYSRMTLILLGCASISAACWLVYKELSLLTERRYALLGFVCCVVLAGLSPWMSIFYSDSMAIVFPVLTLYLYTKGSLEKAGKRGYVHKVLALLVCCIGYFIKPQCFIAVIAIIAVEFIGVIRTRKKKDMGVFVSMLAVSLICLTLFSRLLTFAFESTGVPLNTELKYGMTHFLMMGMNEKDGGSYSEEDFYFSASFDTFKERSAGELREAGARVRAMGPVGLGRHLCKKLLTVYHDGTFAWGVEGNWYTKIVENINTRMAPLLQSVYYPDGSRQEVFKTGAQAFWIFVLLFTTVSGFMSLPAKKPAVVHVLKLTVVGFTLFELLFEVRARYVFLYVPFFCILAALGFGALCGSFPKNQRSSPKS